MRTFALLICLLPAAFALSQEPAKAAPPATQENPLSDFTKVAYGQLKVWLLRSAEKVPEEDYNFKPTAAVRSFGQILGHVADAQYLFCSALRDEKNPAPKIEQTKKSKTELITALKDAFAYCDKAYDGMTDASATQMVKMSWGDTPKVFVLHANNMHGFLHYGNLVTYMRLKNIVPPSSEPPVQPPPNK
jgi:uncharacterized damage-inducible protein DinB